MTARSDGLHICDRCGSECGNGGVFDALVVADMKMDEGAQVVNLHFCRATWQEDGSLRAGCDSSILTARNLENFLEEQPIYTRPEKGSPPLQE